MVKPIHLWYHYADEDVATLKGEYYAAELSGIAIGSEDADVFRPDGSLLCSFRKNALPKTLGNKSFPVIGKAATNTIRRFPSPDRKLRRKNSGTLGYASKKPVAQTNKFQKRGEWNEFVIPFATTLNRLYKKHCPKHFAFQRTVADDIPSDLLIGDSVFTTMTVNLHNQSSDARTPVHQDSENLKGGLAAITVRNVGEWPGGWLLFPKYDVQVALKNGDVLFADNCEFHATSQLINEDKGAERLVVIAYLSTSNM